MRTKNLLIIGKLPPPLGGVTIHTKRLVEQLQLLGYSFVFRKLSIVTLLILPFELIRTPRIHLHSSSPCVRLYVATIGFVFRAKTIITFHGNIGRYRVLLNIADMLTIKLTKYPIVLNESSYKAARSLNKNAQLISAFIPPLLVEDLPEETYTQIYELKHKVTKLFCTNAFNRSFDKNGREIYQISNLVNLFKKNKDLGLLVSDPSASYLKALENEIWDCENIKFISYPHDFNAVIRESDFMLRYTTTDGDSLSVKEALLLQKTVIATNVVTRPKGVVLINLDISELEKLIKEIKPSNYTHFEEDTIRKLINVYDCY